jgi:AcrR family transcriptional regulator
VDPENPETKGERTRRSILDAAISRFAREGYRGTSVSDVARDVGVGGSAVYAYFPNKEALFVAAVDEDAARHIHDTFAALPVGFTTGDARGAVVALLDALERHPLARRVLAGLEPEFTVRLIGIAALEQIRKDLGEYFAAEQAAGVVRPDVDPRAMARGLVTLVLSLLMSLVQTGLEPVDYLGDDIDALFRAALRAPGRG